jgi:hypothetical protein
VHGRRVMLFPCGPKVFLDGDGPTGGSRKQEKHGIEMGMCRGLLICVRGEVAGIVAHGYWFALQIAQSHKRRSKAVQRLRCLSWLAMQETATSGWCSCFWLRLCSSNFIQTRGIRETFSQTLGARITALVFHLLVTQRRRQSTRPRSGLRTS